VLGGRSGGGGAHVEKFLVTISGSSMTYIKWEAILLGQ